MVEVPYEQDFLLITVLGIIQEPPASFGINGKCKNVGIYALNVYQCQLCFTRVTLMIFMLYQVVSSVLFLTKTFFSTEWINAYLPSSTSVSLPSFLTKASTLA
eukprot:7395288-Ditylum_brightwellii.AAC.1